jgi:hypothetical protein
VRIADFRSPVEIERFRDELRGAFDCLSREFERAVH